MVDVVAGCDVVVNDADDVGIGGDVSLSSACSSQA